MSKERLIINDAVKLGTWEEVEGVALSTITKNDKDTEKLNGLVIRGYEMKWGQANQNGEKYEKGAFDKFIQSYFVENKLNMPVDIQHMQDIRHLAGRVLLIEVNSVGFYFVVYIPRTYMYYEAVKNLIKEGILQGFSKMGWATDYEFMYNKNGQYDYTLIKEMEILSVSLVTTPANSLPFEKIGEVVKDSTTFKNKIKEKENHTGVFDNLFFNN